MKVSALVWHALVGDGLEVARTTDVAALARRIRKDPADVATALVRSRRLIPLFKGYYYVRRPEDMGLLPPRHNALELFALGARAKGIGPWYFGLETALRLNGMTHEDGGVDFVVNARLFRPSAVKVGLRRFVILRWKPEMLAFGGLRDGLLRWSNPEKTLLDLAFHETNRAARGAPRAGLWTEYVGSVDTRKARAYLRHYPPRVAEAVTPWM